MLINPSGIATMFSVQVVVNGSGSREVSTFLRSSLALAIHSQLVATRSQHLRHFLYTTLHLPTCTP